MPKQINNKEGIKDFIKTHTWKNACRKFGISEMTINRMLKKEKKEKSIECLELLKSLYGIMTEKMIPKAKLSDNEKQTIMKVTEMIK